MSVQPESRMSVDEFLAWAGDRPERYELLDGEVVAMSPQRVGHARTKYRVHSALERAISAAGLNCEMLPDGVTVRIDARTAFEPDALVQCGATIPDDVLEADSPIIVVEVLSPGTGRVDTVQKLDGYFRVSSIVHYLIVDLERRKIIHHRRGADDLIETRITATGTLTLDPPGLRLDLADVFAPPPGEPERPLA